MAEKPKSRVTSRRRRKVRISSAGGPAKARKAAKSLTESAIADILGNLRSMEDALQLVRVELSVGFHEETTKEPAKSFQVYADGTVELETDTSISVMDKAVANEFGNDEVPRRPFMALTARREGKKWTAFGKKQIEKYVAAFKEDRAPNPATFLRNMNKLGLVMKGAVQLTITDLRRPPNSAETIEAKGSSNPLINTGQMRASVKYNVRSNGKLAGVG